MPLYKYKLLCNFYNTGQKTPEYKLDLRNKLNTSFHMTVRDICSWNWKLVHMDYSFKTIKTKECMCNHFNFINVTF